eukprot:UC1_evm1s1263
MAGEISLVAALASGDLLKAHMELGRKVQSSADATTTAAASDDNTSNATGADANAEPASSSSTTTTVNSQGLGPRTVARHIGHPSSGGPLGGLSSFNTLPSPAMVASRAAGEQHAARATNQMGNIIGAGPAQTAAATGATPSAGLAPG